MLNKTTLVKFFYVVGIYVFWIITQTLFESDNENYNENYNDNFHNIVDNLHNTKLFTTIYEFLSNNTDITRYLFIFTSLMIDINISYFILGMLLSKKNNYDYKRILFLVGFGTLCRQMCQYLNKLPQPSSLIWFDPGFPSIFVTYGTVSDFFFSGHTYMAILFGSEFMNNGKSTLLKFYGLFHIFAEVLFVVGTRSHYAMDVYGAISTYFMSVYFYDRYFKKF